MTALWAEGCGIALLGDEYEVSVTGLAFLCHRGSGKRMADSRLKSDRLTSIAPFRLRVVAPFGRRFYRESSLLCGAPFRWMGIPADSGQRIADSGLYRPASPTHYCH